MSDKHREIIHQIHGIDDPSIIEYLRSTIKELIKKKRLPMKKKYIKIAMFMGYEYVTIGYFGDDTETVWQVKNRLWIEKNDMDQVGDYFVNKRKNVFYEWDEISFDTSWTSLIPVCRKIKEIWNLMIEEWDMERMTDWQTDFNVAVQDMMNFHANFELKETFKAVINCIDLLNKEK